MRWTLNTSANTDRIRRTLEARTRILERARLRSPQRVAVCGLPYTFARSTALLRLEMALNRLDDEACLAPTRALYLALNLTEQGLRAVERNAEVARLPFRRTFRRRRFPRRGPFTVCVRRVRRGGCGGFGGCRGLGGRRRGLCGRRPVRLARGGRGACGRDEIIEGRGCALSLRHGGTSAFSF